MLEIAGGILLALFALWALITFFDYILIGLLVACCGVAVFFAYVAFTSGILVK